MNQYSINQSADTRMKNDIAQASQVSTGQPINRVRNISRSAPVSVNRSVASFTPQASQPSSISNVISPEPQVGSLISPPNNMGPPAQPANDQPDYDGLLEDVAFENFMSSPEVQQAVVKEKLREYFKKSPGDPATFAARVLDSLPQDE